MATTESYSYRFTEDWFDFNIPTWEVALSKFKGKESVRALEVGSFQGRSAVWLLENILTHEHSTIICVDTFEGSIEHSNEQVENMYDIFMHNIKPFTSKVTVMKGLSQHVLRKLKPEPRFDIIYIDGDHRAASVLEDGVLAFRLLKKGGIMIFDDYEWEPERTALETPKLGVIAFCNVYNDKINLIFKGYQVIIEKVSD